jgi:hypothetical protein
MCELVQLPIDPISSALQFLFLNKNKKIQLFKIYKLCDNSGYTYNMTVYYNKDADITIGNLMATHSFARNLTHKTEGIRHKVFKDNLFPHPFLLKT